MLTLVAEITSSVTFIGFDNQDPTMQYKLKYYGLSLLSAVTLAAVPASAQQITGTPGSPSATVTIDGKQLPLGIAARVNYYAGPLPQDSER